MAWRVVMPAPLSARTLPSVSRMNPSSGWLYSAPNAYLGELRRRVSTGPLVLLLAAREGNARDVETVVPRVDLAVQEKVLVEVAVPEVLPGVENEPAASGVVRVSELRGRAGPERSGGSTRLDSRGEEELGDRHAPPVEPARDVGAAGAHESPPELLAEHGDRGGCDPAGVLVEIGGVVAEGAVRRVLVTEPPQAEDGLNRLLGKDGDEDLADRHAVLGLDLVRLVDAVLLEQRPPGAVDEVKRERDDPVCATGSRARSASAHAQEGARLAGRAGTPTRHSQVANGAKMLEYLSGIDLSSSRRGTW